eukprot:SAG22_NODE_395_length_11139_cov_14.562500_10_plen_44_part_00
MLARKVSKSMRITVPELLEKLMLRVGRRSARVDDNVMEKREPE